jgi:hypothetical protein
MQRWIERITIVKNYLTLYRSVPQISKESNYFNKFERVEPLYFAAVQEKLALPPFAKRHGLGAGRGTA